MEIEIYEFHHQFLYIFFKHKKFNYDKNEKFLQKSIGIFYI